MDSYIHKMGYNKRGDLRKGRKLGICVNDGTRSIAQVMFKYKSYVSSGSTSNGKKGR